MKVLITTPRLYRLGGVAGYYRTIRKYLQFDYTFFEVGALDDKENLFRKLFRLFKDIKKFLFIIKNNHYDVVHINPSLNFKAVIRDALILSCANKYGLPVVTFFHGWRKDFERLIDKKLHFFFYNVYNKSNIFIVLSSEFKNKLRSWGFKQPIHIEFNPVDDDLVKDFDIESSLKERINFDVKNILFLARIVKEKGIFESIESVYKVQKKLPVKLIIAGNGANLKEAQDFAKKLKFSNCFFVGYVKGKDKIEIFKKANLYLFPSYYYEGLPISVLEAMSFGLPVITRPVGGIKDFFQNGKHGYLTNSKDPNVFATLIENLLRDNNLYLSVSKFNYKFSRENFLASKVARRLEYIYREVY